MDVLFKNEGMSTNRLDFEVLDTGWMGGVSGVLFFNGVAELKRRLDHMPISDLIVRERDDARRERAEAQESSGSMPGFSGSPILSKGKDW